MCHSLGVPFEMKSTSEHLIRNHMQLKMKPDIRRSPRLHPPPRRSPRIKERQSSPVVPQTHSEKQQEIQKHEQEMTQRSYSPRQTPPSKSITPKSASKTSSSVKFRRTIVHEQRFHKEQPASTVRRRKSSSKKSTSAGGKRLFRSSVDEGSQENRKRLKNTVTKAQDKGLLGRRKKKAVIITTGFVGIAIAIVLIGKFMLGLW